MAAKLLIGEKFSDGLCQKLSGKNLERVTSLVFILYVLGAFTHRSMEFPLPDFFSENENYLHMSYTQISSARFKFGTSISLNKNRFFCSASFYDIY